MKDIKGIMLLADLFEDIEAIGTLDLLRRAKINIDTVSVTGKKELKTQSNIILQADKLVEEINLDEYDFCILPGGQAIMKTHLNSDITKMVLEVFLKKNLLVACICAAPSVIGKEGYLNNLDYTCFPSFEKMIENGNYQPDKKVVVSGNIITSKACGTTFEFAYEIIKYLRGSSIADHVLSGIFYQN